jgi:ribosomal protein S27E
MSLAIPAATQERCDNCGGLVAWDGAARRLTCAACGTQREVAPGGAGFRDHDLLGVLVGRKPRGRLGDAAARQVKCQECGAAVLFPDGTVATRCSFCDSPSVLAQETRSDQIVPESLVPFGFGREQAVTAFKTWLGKRWFGPSNLTDEAVVSELRGVYVPYWTFTVHVRSNWAADVGYYYDVREEYTDGSGQRQTRTVRKTRWESAFGKRDDDHRDHLVCASKGLPGGLEQRAASFDTAGLTAWAPQFLSGFVAESYAVELPEGWQRAQSEIAAIQEVRCRHDLPGDTQRDLRANHRFENPAFKHVLLPMWIAAFRYQGKVFRFLVNGQSGIVAGEAPRSWTKVLLLIAAIVAFIVGLVLLLGNR